MNEKKQSIGIMTFHWATNYGAVLQAWALQHFLDEHHYNAEIIDYRPKEYKLSYIRCFFTRNPHHISSNIVTYKKEKAIEKFRKQHLKLTSVLYSSKNELRKAPPLYDIYISGSDQIWNPYFTMRGQRGLTLSYYLDFVPTHSRRIAYASSFGCSNIMHQVMKDRK